MIYKRCNKQNITCPLMDMNFIFSWSTRYLTSERSERVRYRVDHEKIKFISTHGHVISSIYSYSCYRTFHFLLPEFSRTQTKLRVHGKKTSPLILSQIFFFPGRKHRTICWENLTAYQMSLRVFFHAPLQL